MKSKAERHSEEKQSGTTINSGSGSKGISAPAVPVLQKAAVTEQEHLQVEPTQLMGEQVIQQAKGDKKMVTFESPSGLARLTRGGAISSLLPLPGAGGGGGGGAVPLAPVHGGAGPAPTISGSVSSPSSTPIIASGGSGSGPAPSPSASPSLAEPGGGGWRRAPDPHASTPKVSTLPGGASLHQGHIDSGTWAPIPPSPRFPREDNAYQLTTNIDGVTYHIHIHPGSHGTGIPGAVMRGEHRDGGDGSNASLGAASAIIAKHGIPSGWA